MLTCDKQILPVHFLKFGVDDHGVIIPILRRSRKDGLQLNVSYRPVQLMKRAEVRAR
jgi:hypothetical protein